MSAINYPLSRCVQTDLNVFSIYLTESLYGDPATGFAVIETIVAFISVEPVGPDQAPRLRLRVSGRFTDAFQSFVFDDEGGVAELYLKVLQRLQAVAEGRALLAEATKLLPASSVLPEGGVSNGG